MKEIKLDGETYQVRATFNTVRNIFKSVSPEKLEKGDQFATLELAYKLTWQLLKPKRFFKPYLFYWRFKKYADIEDLAEAQNIILEMIFPNQEEDGDTGNV